MEYMYQPCGYRHIDEHADDVVCNRDEGSRRDCRVYLEFFEREGYESPEHGGEHHHAEYRSRYGEGRYLMAGTEGDEVVDEHQQRDDASVQESHPEFLQKLA